MSKTTQYSARCVILSVCMVMLSCYSAKMTKPQADVDDSPLVAAVPENFAFEIARLESLVVKGKTFFFKMDSLLAQVDTSSPFDNSTGQRDTIQHNAYVDSLKQVRENAEIKWRKVLTGLFYLYIHPDNPEQDYTRALTYVSLLAEAEPTERGRMLYQGLAMLLLDYIDIQQSNPDLNSQLTKQKKTSQALRRANRNLRQEITELKKTIQEQTATIEKLNALDIQMEQQRDLIK